MRKLKNIKEFIHHLLVTDPECRDDDRRLLIKVWAEEQPRLRDEMFPFKSGFAMDFLAKDLSGNHPNFSDPETVRRTRQKLQEADPLLRGRNYIKRRGTSEKLRLEYRD